MLRFLLAMFFSLFISCTTVVGQNKPIMHNGRVIESAFKSYVEEFERLCKCKVEFDMIFSELFLKKYVGVCLKPIGIVAIRESYWKNLHAYEKELLIFHELGHCVLNRDHDKSDKMMDFHKIRASMMYPRMLNQWDYQSYRDYYLKELFQ